MQDRDAPARDGRGVPLGPTPPASTPTRRTGVIAERMEDPDRVRAAADAGDDGVGQPPGLVEHLRAGLARR